MYVTLLTRDPCGICGYLRRGFMFSSVRVNKRSMRTVGTNLVVAPGRCEECGRISGLPSILHWQVDPADAAKIQAYRLRRWPELATEHAATAA